MDRINKDITKKLISSFLSLQLIFTLSGFIANVNPSDCCHTKKIVKKVHSCCKKMVEKESLNCKSSQPIQGHTLSNCGCINSNPERNLDYTVQNNFELQKENLITVIPFYVDQQTLSYISNFKQKIEKEHSPPLFLLDSTLLI